MITEAAFQNYVIARIYEMFPNQYVIGIKNDPTYLQGLPDLLFLIDDKWLALEVKRDEKAKKQPNQKWYIDKMNEMSFARFIYPENAEEIFDEIQQAF